jgi:ABC-type nickel/cobalt efflux system permease component RcnA
MPEEQLILIVAAASVGVVHTLIGPDHYLPFITLARAREWSLPRTVAVTMLSGIGHVAGSVLLGFLGLALGWALGGLERFEALRSEIAGWLLLAFGIAYLFWGLRQAYLARPHSHRHIHADGTVHLHQHTHHAEHGHLHDADAGFEAKSVLKGATAWSIFIIFVLGPCEPLIPLLMYPAASGQPVGIAIVVAVFALTTVTTMTTLVIIGRAGLQRLPAGHWERWSHAAAGAIIAACGVAITLGL